MHRFLCVRPTGKAAQLIKLHRSVNWARVFQTRASYHNNNPWTVVRDHIERAASLEISNVFVQTDQHPCGLFENGLGLVPAVAIPVEQKAYFECPETHLRELERLLPQIDKLLLIGWRASEDHFLELLRKHLKGPILAQVVAGSEGEARNIARGLQEGALSHITVHWEHAPAGFTDFIVNRRADAMLSRTESE